MPKSTKSPKPTKPTKATVSTKNKSSPAQMPIGWIVAGSHPKEYDMGVAADVRHSGTRCGFIKSIATRTHGFGTMMQMFVADKYKAKRVRLSAYIKADSITDWAGLWFRIDGPAVQSFDNMQGRPITGTKDWTRYECVLDVPEQSTNIAFGVLLSGKGQVWFDDLMFEEVDLSVASTNILGPGKSGGQLDQPTNLDFEQNK
jgi:hypothetical protein